VIWHFLEVWLLVAVSFAVGCALGALLYGALADSPLALAQGAVADAVGDAVDWVKVRLGIGPAWRPELARSLTRPGQPSFGERVEPLAFDDEPPLAHDPEHEASYVAIALADPVADEALVVEVVEDALADDFSDDEAAEPVAAIAAAPKPAALPAPAKPAIVPMRPAGLSKPRGGVPDNLTRIRGIGQRNERVLNDLGIYHFSQIAAWTPGEVLWIGRYLAFPERIERDDWVSQAMVLATGGDTGFSKSADRRRKRRAEDRLRRALADAANAPDAAAKTEPPRAEENADDGDDENENEDEDEVGGEESKS
jgi:predicted flap endonuclease-1-like 5' DNA nuclease